MDEDHPWDLSLAEDASAYTSATQRARVLTEGWAALWSYCPSCGAARAVVSAQQLCCAECGTPTPELLSGRELEVVAMEIQ